MFKLEYIYILLPKLSWFLILNLLILDLSFDPEVFLGAVNYTVVCLLFINILYGILLTVSMNEKVFYFVKTLVLTRKKDIELYETLSFIVLNIYKKVLIKFYLWNLLRLWKSGIILEYAHITQVLKKEWYQTLKNFEMKIIKSIIITNYYSYILKKKHKNFSTYCSALWRSPGEEFIKHLFLVKKIDSYSFYKWVVLIYEDWILRIK